MGDTDFNDTDFDDTDFNEIDFDKMRCLAPAIVQDATTGEVLMLGFMNREAYQHTLAVGYVTFYSRTRNQLWTKGETSGNRLRVTSAATDCDCDTLLFRVIVEGAGVVCHEGTTSCFTKPIFSKSIFSKSTQLAEGNMDGQIAGGKEQAQ